MVLHLFYLGALRNQFLEEFGKPQNRWKKGNFLWYVTAGARIRMQLSNFSTVIKKRTAAAARLHGRIFGKVFLSAIFFTGFLREAPFFFFFLREKEPLIRIMVLLHF